MYLIRILRSLERVAPLRALRCWDVSRACLLLDHEFELFAHHLPLQHATNHLSYPPKASSGLREQQPH